LQNNIIPKEKFNESMIIDIADKLKDTMIRGIKNIIHTELIEIPISKITEDDSIVNTKELFIETNGTNLEEILELPVVDKYRTQTNSIEEILLMSGIEAAKLKIVNEIQKAMSSSDAITEHCLIVAEEMTSSGVITSIQKTGLQSRDASNISLQLAFQAPIQVITKAATDSIVEHVQGVSGPLIYGQICKLGTTYNDVLLDEEMISSYMKKNNSDLDSILIK
jgi:DNA-directed RNA polymerase II subunit RPB1